MTRRRLSFDDSPIGAPALIHEVDTGKRDGKALTYVWTYDSLDELVRAAESEPTYTPTTSSSRKVRDDEWAGGSWDDAVALARDGWVETLPMVADTFDAIGSADRPVFGVVHDVSGSEVDIARYCAGVPECMADVPPIPRAAPMVTFVCPVTYSAGVTVDRIIARGLAVVGALEELRIQGVTVRVFAGAAQHLSDHPGKGPARSVYLAEIADTRQAYDPARVTYACAHPSMLRRLIFSLEERSGSAMDKAKSYGYGMPTFDIYREDLAALGDIDPGTVVTLPPIPLRGEVETPDTVLELVREALAAPIA